MACAGDVSVCVGSWRAQLTFSSHADLEALFEAAVLALVAVMLVNWTVAVASAGVL